MKRGGGWVGAMIVGGGLALASPPPGQTGTVTGVIYIRDARSDGAVIYLAPSRTNATPAREPIVMDQRELQFQPAVLPIVVGGSVAFRNSDPLLHNIFSPDTFGEAFDLGTYPEGESRIRRFFRPGAHLIMCHIHPEMEAYVVVVPSAHVAVADAKGRFRLADVPAGTYEAHVWHRRAEPREVTVTVVPGGTVYLEIQLQRRARKS